ncbi:ATP-binding mismatch repair protein [Sporothrix eucalyptigena]|uniref:ATP-binding mismatch repair protein n=1 Tax=Sporothrix eucalyptigena TaxID=1812306 RepID=A0ABP0BJ64_9PEZI
MATTTAATPASVTIKAIDATAVHRIQSGQVIVNLCSVAKELVENSLDAGATSIEVRFKNQGLDAIEVQDNGSGIAPHNYASLALKHYTSKLSTFDDLDTLQTFGFRGEALSSLCALSRFSVTTCLATDVPKGTRLEFETSGRLGQTSVVAAQKGTTVTVENLFWNLPVRRRELERNIKREWAKVIGLLNQYACIQTGVKFTVSQQPSKGKRVVLFSTKGNAATRDNIINVFGAKTMGALLALDLDLEMTITKSQWATSTNANANLVHVRGFVSRPAHGQGRQTPDRQMFYVNGRPCKLPQFAQLFGEVYRSYNSGQSPFIFADIQLDTHLYDVNVSPDKQTILLHDQGRMLDTLRESLIELFEKQDITVPISQLASQKLTAFKKAAVSSSSAPPSSASKPPESTTSTPLRSGGRDIQKIQTAADDDEASDEEDVAGEAPTPAQDHAVTANDNSTPIQESKANGAQEDSPDEPMEEADAMADVPFSQPTPSQRPSRQATTNVVVHHSTRKRLSDEIATVKVGSETVSRPVLTSPIAKRQKTVVSSSSAGSRTASDKKKKAKAPLPSFGGRLSQMFSAGRRSSNEEEEVEEDEDEQDSDAQSDDNVEESTQEEDVADDQEEEEKSDAEVDEPMDDVEEDLDQEIFSGDTTDKEEAPEAEEDDREPSPMDDIIQQDEDALHNHESVDEEDDVEQDAAHEEQEHSHKESNDNEDQAEDDEDEEDVEDDDRPVTAAEVPIFTDEEKRNRLFLKSGGGSKKRHETLQLVQVLKANEALVGRQAATWHTTFSSKHDNNNGAQSEDDKDDDYHHEISSGLDDTEAVAEAKLALTIVKDDFAKMRVVGQFNLGFILAVREAAHQEADDSGPSSGNTDDELFIIDQHASDEKYNFERLQASTVVQSQRLVQPKRLELTAIEEEIVLEHLPALAANGFVVDAELDGSEPVGSRCKLRTLPLSRETTFDLTDLEELIALLGDHHDHHGHDDHDHAGHLTAVPRPAKVRKMFAMRACRSSIMIGKALSRRQMSSVLAHMGEMDKPWNCPHGRPTMRHLCSLGAAWDKSGRTWGASEQSSASYDDDFEHGDGQAIRNADWAKFLKKRRRAAKA